MSQKKPGPQIVPTGTRPAPGDQRLERLDEDEWRTRPPGSIAATLRQLFDQIAERERKAEEKAAKLKEDAADYQTRWVKECQLTGDLSEKVDKLEETVGELADRSGALEAVLEAKGLYGAELSFVLESADIEGALRTLAAGGRPGQLRLVRS